MITFVAEHPCGYGMNVNLIEIIVHILARYPISIHLRGLPYQARIVASLPRRTHAVEFAPKQLLLSPRSEHQSANPALTRHNKTSPGGMCWLLYEITCAVSHRRSRGFNPGAILPTRSSRRFKCGSSQCHDYPDKPLCQLANQYPRHSVRCVEY